MTIATKNGRVILTAASLVAGNCPCCKKPCGSQSNSGGDGVTVRAYDFPEEEGDVQFTYQAFSVKDRFTVYSGEQTFFDTEEPISGGATVSFFKPFGVTTISVRVEGPSGTAWNYTIGCPQVGACCNGTICSVKPQSQCNAAAGEVFKGVGTVCSPNPCFRYCSNGGFASVIGALSRKCDFLDKSGPSAAKIATGYTCPTQAGDVSPCCPQNSPEIAPLYSTKNFNPTAADCMCCYESEVEPGGFLAQKSQSPSSLTLTISGTNSATLNGVWVLSSTAALGVDLAGFVPVSCANFVFPTSVVAIGATPCQFLNSDNLFCGPVVANPELVVDIRLRGDSFSISGNSLIVNVNDYFPTKNAFTNAPCGCGNANYGASVSEMRAAISSALGLNNPTFEAVQYAFQRWLCGSQYSGISISGVLRNIQRASGEYFADDGVWVLSK